MAIRWSAKGKRFYDDQTGYPVTRGRARLSATARRSYRQAHHTRKCGIPDKELAFKKKYRPPKGYRVRPLEEEFAEEYEAYDGTISREMSLEAYTDMIGESEPDVYDQEDRYSED